MVKPVDDQEQGCAQPVGEPVGMKGCPSGHGRPYPVGEDPDVSSPRVPDPVHRCMDTDRVEYFESGLGAVCIVYR